MDITSFVHISKSELCDDLKAHVQNMKGGAYKQEAIHKSSLNPSAVGWEGHRPEWSGVWKPPPPPTHPATYSPSPLS